MPESVIIGFGWFLVWFLYILFSVILVELAYIVWMVVKEWKDGKR